MVTSSPPRPVELSPQPAVARRELARLLTDAHWDGNVDGVMLAVHEAMVNSDRHAGGVTRAEAAFDGPTVVVKVRDRGAGFGIPRRRRVPDITAERGRGLFLIQQLADDVQVVKEGRDVCLQLRFER